MNRDKQANGHRQIQSGERTDILANAHRQTERQTQTDAQANIKSGYFVAASSFV